MSDNSANNETDLSELLFSKEIQEFLLEDFGTVKASVVHSLKHDLLALNLEKPLNPSIPFLPELEADGLQIQNGSKEVQAFLFKNPPKVPYTLPSEKEPQYLSVIAIGLVPQGKTIYYLLVLSYPAKIGDHNYVSEILVDANGQMVGGSPVHITF